MVVTASARIVLPAFTGIRPRHAPTEAHVAGLHCRYPGPAASWEPGPWRPAAYGWAPGWGCGASSGLCRIQFPGNLGGGAQVGPVPGRVDAAAWIHRVSCPRFGAVTAGAAAHGVFPGSPGPCVMAVLLLGAQRVLPGGDCGGGGQGTTMTGQWAWRASQPGTEPATWCQRWPGAPMTRASALKWSATAASSLAGFPRRVTTHTSMPDRSHTWSSSASSQLFGLGPGPRQPDDLAGQRLAVDTGGDVDHHQRPGRAAGTHQRRRPARYGSTATRRTRPRRDDRSGRRVAAHPAAPQLGPAAVVFPAGPGGAKALPDPWPLVLFRSMVRSLWRARNALRERYVHYKLVFINQLNGQVRRRGPSEAPRRAQLHFIAR